MIFSTFSIKTRLLISFLICAVLSIALGFLGYMAIRQIKTSIVTSSDSVEKTATQQNHHRTEQERLSKIIAQITDAQSTNELEKASRTLNAVSGDLKMQENSRFKNVA